MSDDPLFKERLELAGSGDRDAQYAVAQAYLFGTGVEESVEQALSWLRKAAEDGHRAAQVQLGDHFRFGIEGGEDLPQAAMWYRRAADQNDAHAQYKLGQMYLDGVGVARDALAAANLFRAAAVAGNADAIAALATMGDAGELTEASAAWLDEAAGQGDADAQHNRGNACWDGAGTPQDRPAAVAWYEKAAAQGHGKAQHRLAQLFWAGEEVGRARTRAVDLYRKAASQGVAEAQTTLVHLYLNGVHVGADTAEALRWLRQAAWWFDEGTAQHLLGEMYLAGDGVPANPVEAERWLKLAAQCGVGRAQATLGRMYFAGHGAPLDPVQAVHWLTLAAGKGERQASLDLGRLYLSGAAGVPADLAAAEQHLEAAAPQGTSGPAGSALDVATVWLESGVERGVVLAEALLRRVVGRDDLGVEDWYATGLNRVVYRARGKGAARRQLAAAAYQLGQCYRAGFGVDMDLVKAAKWLHLAHYHDEDLAAAAATQVDDIQAHLLGGSPAAFSDLAARVAADCAQDRDLPLTVRRTLAGRWWRIAAEAGDPSAQFVLGSELSGTEEGVQWLSKAAEAGHDAAQFALAQAYESGAGTKREPDEAIVWLRRAAGQGHRDATVRLADLLRARGDADGLAEATTLYQQAADHGHEGAQVALANLYLARGGESDAEAAANLLKKSGWAWRENVGRHFDAMLSLAVACMTGDGVTRDTAWATMLLHEATQRAGEDEQKGVAVGAALYALAQRYRDGVGIERNPMLAIKWFDAAGHFGVGNAGRCRHQIDRLLDEAGGGRADLQRHVGAACLNDEGCPAFRARGDFWFQRADAETGTADDWRAFGLTLLEGGELEEAVQWIRQAAESGHGPAQEDLAELYAQGRGVAVDPIEAARWQARAEQARELAAGQR
jgi:hypothetical protein